MAVFTSAAMGLRKKIITDALKRSGAVSAETAKTLAESGVENPDMFREYTEQLADFGLIHRTADGRYWVDGN